MTEATGFEARTGHGVLEVDPKTGGFRSSVGRKCPAVRIGPAAQELSGVLHAVLE
jgi:hypothetical protein